MGERLAKELNALWQAESMQSPEWHKAAEEGQFDAEGAVRFLFDAVGVLKSLIIRLASELEDPPSPPANPSRPSSSTNG